jgi:hypothetical protein
MEVFPMSEESTLKKAKETISSIYKGITTPCGGSCGLQIPSEDRRKFQESTQQRQAKDEKNDTK